MMRARLQMMGLVGLVGLALASAFVARETRDKAQDVAISLGSRTGKSLLTAGRTMRRPAGRGHSSGKIGPKRRRRLWRAEARRKAAA